MNCWRNSYERMERPRCKLEIFSADANSYMICFFSIWVVVLSCGPCSKGEGGERERVERREENVGQ